MTQRLEEGRWRGPWAAEAEDGKRNGDKRGCSRWDVVSPLSNVSAPLWGSFPQKCGAMHSAELLPQFPLPLPQQHCGKAGSSCFSGSAGRNVSPVPPPHLTRANIWPPHHHLCNTSTLQAPPSPPVATGHLLCLTTSYSHLCKAYVWAAAYTEPGGSGAAGKRG